MNRYTGVQKLKQYCIHKNDLFLLIYEVNLSILKINQNPSVNNKKIL